MTIIRRTFLALVLSLLPAAGSAQTPRLDRELRVFFDCPDTDCDEDFLTEQIGWVDFVRDRTVADVHVLVTEQETGGGGDEVTLRFIGRGVFDGREQALVHVLPADATEDDERRTMVRNARLGLASYAAATPVAARLDVSIADGPADAPAGAAADPWDRWVFELGMDSWFQGESQFQVTDLYGFAAASRVTDDWHLTLNLNAQNNSETFELDDSTTVESHREAYSANSLVARTLSPHWSTGLWSGASRSTRSNYDMSLRLGTAIEYSIFPYAESTGRLLTVLYVIGPRYFDYAERTLFDRTHETTLHHFLAVSYDATQPWGEIDALLDITHIIAPIDGSDDWGEPQYSISLNGGVEVRVVRGLSLRLQGGTELVRDQIHLAAGGLTEEEILTKQREQATDYRYWASFGFSYEFGSIFSPVVNRRLDYLQ